MTMKKEFTKDNSSMLVLSVLANNDMYGYEIIKEIEQKSENAFSLREGTLYPILHEFERDGLVTSYWLENESLRKRKYYRITDKGNKILAKTKEEWETYSQAINKVVTGGTLNATT